VKPRHGDESASAELASAASTAAAAPAYPRSAYSWYVVAILMLIYVNSFLDRQILGLLVDPIRATLSISESQMGFLMGPAFGVFYIIAGVPLGRLADLISRRWLIFIGQLFWSVMSVGCGLVRTFGQFLGLRVGLGVGEASLSPAAYSMITDLFPPHQLARALSVYAAGIYIGGGAARFAGGLVVKFAEDVGSWTVPLLGREVHAWQIVFFFIAAPTIPLSILLLTIKEPRRRGVRMVRNAAGKQVEAAVPMREVLGYIWQNRRTMFCHSLGFAMLAFSGYGVAGWMPSHLIRNLGMNATEVGIALGFVGMTVGVCGVFLGGMLADRLFSRGVQNARMMVGFLSSVVWFLPGLLYPLMNTPTLAITLYGAAILVSSMSSGVGPAAVQEIMPNKMRGQASALYLFVVNLFGLGFGPYILALFTQYVFKADSAVRWSLLVVPAGAHVLAALLLFFGLESFKASKKRLESWQAENA
jgi:MFS family permease